MKRLADVSALEEARQKVERYKVEFASIKVFPVVVVSRMLLCTPSRCVRCRRRRSRLRDSVGQRSNAGQMQV